MTMQRFGVLIAAGVFVWGLAGGGPVLQATQAQGPRKLDISFDKGLVTIEAQNVTVREILLEWGRKGGSRIVNAEKLAGPALPFVEFKAEPEVVVLRSLLRDVPGYGAAPRLTDVAGASTIEAVFILATRSVPVSGAVSAGAPMQSNSQVQQLVPQGPPQPQAAPRPIEGSVDSEILPVLPMQEALPPTTPGAATSNPNLRTGPGGTVTSTIPGVVIPGPTTPTTSGTTPPPTGGRGRGGGGGGVPSV